MGCDGSSSRNEARAVAARSAEWCDMFVEPASEASGDGRGSVSESSEDEFGARKTPLGVGRSD